MAGEGRMETSGAVRPLSRQIPRRVAALRAVALVAALAAILFTFLIFAITYFWWQQGFSDRISFGTWEGIPFLVVAGLFIDGGYNLFRLRRHGWWLALAGSLVALAHGVYRSFVSTAYIPGSAGTTPWVSSVPGAWATLLIGLVLLPFLLWCYRPFRQLAWPNVVTG